MSILSRLIAALLACVPLIALLVWAYAPAVVSHYPTIAEMILGASALPLPTVNPQERIIAVVLVVALGLAVLAPVLRSAAAAVFSGALAGTLALNPLLVSALLGTEPRWTVLITIYGVCLVGMAGVLLLTRKLNASLWAFAMLILLAGTALSVRTAALVVLHGNPPLHTLNAIARYPGSASANLAMANHMVFLRGENIAVRYYQRASELLSLSGEPLSDEVASVLRCLADGERERVAASCRAR